MSKSVGRLLSPDFPIYYIPLRTARQTRCPTRVCPAPGILCLLEPDLSTWVLCFALFFYFELILFVVFHSFNSLAS